MKTLLIAASLLAVCATAQDSCAEDNGNWFCQAVRAIVYTQVGGFGAYNKVTNMDSDSGTCSSSPYEYSGNVAPLDEEVSWHIRGPTILKQFAAYTPGSETAEKKKREEHVRRHARDHHHKHHPNRVQERQVGATVTATIDGIVQHWINMWAGTPSEPTSTPEVDNQSDAPAPISTSASVPSSSSSSNSNSSSTSSDDNATYTGPGWGRNAYYNADDQTRSGLVFLNHFGGSGSGVFDYAFGNSLSYATSDGQTGSSTPETLSCLTLPSRSEVVLMRDTPCTDSSCGYTRPGTVAHHGWAGKRKAFFFEFQMPSDGGTTQDIYDPVNMPAIWMLNAQIPRTLQYGNVDCSCWGSGCGEFDMFEVLSPGSTKAKSTLHGNKAGGDSNYFDRPVDAPIKVAMVMFDDNVHIKILDDDVEFPSVMDESTIDEILASTSMNDPLVSLFSLAEAGGD